MVADLVSVADMATDSARFCVNEAPLVCIVTHMASLSSTGTPAVAAFVAFNSKVWAAVLRLSIV